MTSVKPVRITTDEYDQMADAGLFADRHIDLLDGVLYEMPPINTPHILVVVRLQTMLTSFDAVERLLVQVPVRIPEFDEPEPDLAVLREPLTDQRPSAADCLLVIEVSDTTLR